MLRSIIFYAMEICFFLSAIFFIVKLFYSHRLWIFVKSKVEDFLIVMGLLFLILGFGLFIAFAFLSISVLVSI